MKIILGFPNTDGIPVDFESLPDLGEIIAWPQNPQFADYAKAGHYKVESRYYVFNQLTLTMCAFLKLTIEPPVDDWLDAPKDENSRS